MAAKTKTRKPASKSAAKRATPAKGKVATASRKPARKAARKPAPFQDQRRQPESLRLRSASPGLTVNDIAKSVSWYRDVMGFTVKDKWEQNGKLMGVELVAGDVLFMLSQDDWKKGRDRRKGEGFSLYCITVQDVDRLATRARARGATMLWEPRDQPWGMRDFSVKDPDGFKITFGNEKKR